MNSIIEFLNVRVDEDEQQAQLELRFLDAAIIRDRRDKRRRIDPDSGQRTISPWVQRDIDRANRTLREVAAKRAIMAFHCRVDARPGYDTALHGPDPACYGCHANYQEEPAVPDVNECPVLRNLATVYNDHPDYREEWKP